MDKQRFYRKLLKEVTIEKSAFNLFLKSIFNEKICISNIIITTLSIIIAIIFGVAIKKLDNTQEVFLSILTDSFSFSVGITSFLIAAFTIFFTMIRSETSYALLLIKNKDTNESMFKSSLFAFVKPIIFFITLIIYNFVYKIAYPIFSTLVLGKHMGLYNTVVYMCIIIFIFLLIKSILELIYIIYNIYSFVMFITKDSINIKLLESYGANYNKYIENLEKKKNEELENEK